jgi:glucosamine-6-phosphate deaminase
MRENLFKHINIPERFVHIPSGMVDVNDINRIHKYCDWYEEQIEKVGGIDLQILGIGANGHIGFNEPGSSLGARTRIKTLTDKTRRDNARFFEDDLNQVPKYATTMGIGTIMEARVVLLLASGKQKAEAVRNMVEGPITAKVPASMIQMHRKAILILDPEAGSMLDEEIQYEQFVTDLQ